MTGRWKNFIVVFIALWLPLQGYGAVAMPFCEHGPAMPVLIAAESHHVDTQDGHQAHENAAHHDSASDHVSTNLNHSADQQEGLGCNDCGACQLACTPLIVSTLPHVIAFGSAVYDALPVASLVSVSPIQLQRPPLSALI